MTGGATWSARYGPQSPASAVRAPPPPTPHSNPGVISKRRPCMDLAAVCASGLTAASVSADVAAMQPIENVQTVSASRLRLECAVCKDSTGGCIVCDVPGCLEVFHPTCAYVSDQHMQVHNMESGIKFEAFCQRHSKGNAAGAPLSQLPRLTAARECGHRH